MDLSCIISSGDIELYVMGLLPPDEAAKMEQLIGLFPEIREEADRISMALEAAANASGAAPRSSVKDQLFSQLKNLKEQEATVAVKQEHAPTLPTAAQGERGKVVVMNRRKNNWVAAASAAGLVIFLGLAIFYYAKTARQNNELVQVQQQLDSTQRNMQQLQQENLASGQLLRLMQDKNFTPVNLEAVPGKPEAAVQVYWNSQTREVYLVDLSLPQAPAGKQYQFWAIVDGQPVDGGLLTNAKQYAQKMNAFAKADAFAITLENEGGSAAPTLDQLFVLGKPS